MAGPLRAGWQALRSSTASLLLRSGSAAAAATSLSFPATPARFATQLLHQVAQPDSPSTSTSARGASFAHLGLATPSRGQVRGGKGKWPAQQHARLLGRRVCAVCSPDAQGALGPNNLRGLHSNRVRLTAWAPACSGSRSHVCHVSSQCWTCHTDKHGACCAGARWLVLCNLHATLVHCLPPMLNTPSPHSRSRHLLSVAHVDFHYQGDHRPAQGCRHDRPGGNTAYRGVRHHPEVSPRHRRPRL